MLLTDHEDFLASESAFTLAYFGLLILSFLDDLEHICYSSTSRHISCLLLRLFGDNFVQVRECGTNYKLKATNVMKSGNELDVIKQNCIRLIAEKAMVFFGCNK